MTVITADITDECCHDENNGRHDENDENDENDDDDD